MRKLTFMLGLMLPMLTHAQMDTLSNDDLDEVTGQQGVAISLDWRLNADKNGGKLGLCTAAATYKECRIAWAFNNRGTDDVDKRWLVLKGMTGALYIPYLRVDASSAPYTTDGGAAKSVAAVLLSFGDVATGSGATTKVLVKNLIIDNIAMEQDNGNTAASRRGYFADSACEPTGACPGAGSIPAGVNTGFMGLQVSGPNNPSTAAVDPTAQIQIDGTIKLFSCLADHPSC